MRTLFIALGAILLFASNVSAQAQRWVAPGGMFSLDYVDAGWVEYGSLAGDQVLALAGPDGTAHARMPGDNPADDAR